VQKFGITRAEHNLHVNFVALAWIDATSTHFLSSLAWIGGPIVSWFVVSLSIIKFKTRLIRNSKNFSLSSVPIFAKLGCHYHPLNNYIWSLFCKRAAFTASRPSRRTSFPFASFYKVKLAELLQSTTSRNPLCRIILVTTSTCNLCL
jgi:hypothetical protein